MKRIILIASLSAERTGWRSYTLKITLRGGETYRMPTHSKKLYDRLQTSLSETSHPYCYEFHLRLAARVLAFNDIFYDEVEIL